MLRYLILGLVACLLIQMAVANDDDDTAPGNEGGRRRGAKKNRGGKKSDRVRCACVSTECVLNEGETCGIGSKTVTCTPEESCAQRSGMKRCRVPCADDNDQEGGRQRPNGRGRPGRKGKGPKGLCNYTKGNWTECDESTNRMNRTLTLEEGSDESCPHERTISKRCRKTRSVGKKNGGSCKYRPGPWQECNSNNQRVRIMTLKSGDRDTCVLNKTISRPCASDCKYSKAPWSACDSATNTKRREMPLKNEKAGCSPTKVETKPCSAAGGGKKKKNGCSFGPWGEFGSCQNGVQTKTRQVISGDHESCARSAVKTKMCSS